MIMYFFKYMYNIIAKNRLTRVFEQIFDRSHKSRCYKGQGRATHACCPIFTVYIYNNNVFFLSCKEILQLGC